jgi:hypothetical protein
MAIVGGLDIHRRQITYDWIDTDTGETRRGQLSPATRVMGPQLSYWDPRSSKPTKQRFESARQWAQLGAPCWSIC